METTNTCDAQLRNPVRHVNRPRRPFGARIVVAIYALMVLATPLIVRYGSEANVSTFVASTTVGADLPRCANAPEAGLSCKSGNADLLR